MPISKELIAVSKLPWFSNVMKKLGYEPVRHGRWIEKDDECVCPFCGKAWNYMDNCTETFNFCPNCGAMMKE